MVFQEKTYSVLIVSASDSFTNSVMPLLPMTDYWPVTTVRSVGEARRRLTDTEFDIVLINTPLPDDFGMRLAIDICGTSGAGVLLLQTAFLLCRWRGWAAVQAAGLAVLLAMGLQPMCATLRVIFNRK